MNYKLVIAVIISLGVSILNVACSSVPSTSIASGATPKQIKEPQAGAPFVTQTVQKVRVSNCDGQSRKTTIARSLQRGEATSFQVEVEGGGLVRGTPIPGFLEAELDARIKAALARISNVSLQDSVSFDIETDAGNAFDHNVTWNETKVKGTVELIYPDSTARVAFERIIGLELAGRTSNPVGCGAQLAATTVPINNPRQPPLQVTKPLERSTNTPTVKFQATTSSTIQTLCPFTIKQSEVDNWKVGFSDIATVQTYIVKFDAGRYGDGGAFSAGTKIPPGVIVATNFDEKDGTRWSKFPVVPIVHSGSWGLFQTMGEYEAPNAGACRILIP